MTWIALANVEVCESVAPTQACDAIKEAVNLPPYEVVTHANLIRYPDVMDAGQCDFKAHVAARGLCVRGVFRADGARTDKRTAAEQLECRVIAVTERRSCWLHEGTLLPILP
jgi:hypothetical protein